MRTFILTFFWMVTMQIFAFGQDAIQEGFAFLDQGEYETAFVTFSELEKKYPENISVQIGYGRALGLKGEPGKAKAYLSEKATKSQDNLELKLNYIESLLWLGETESAKEKYNDILIEYPDNVVAYIGMGNALSMEKKYEEALKYYEEALVMNPSFSYVKEQVYHARMGQAYLLRLSGDFEKTEMIYRQLLIEYPDSEIVLSALGDVLLGRKKYLEAKGIYSDLKNMEGKNIEALIRLAFIENQLNHPKKAMNLARKALEESEGKKGMESEAEKNYFYALLWNGKIRKAEKYLMGLKGIAGNDVSFGVPELQLAMMKGNFPKAEKILDDIIRNDSTSFDGNLGKANLNYSLGDYVGAKENIEKTLTYYPNQIDAVGLLQKLNRATAPKIQVRSEWLKDNGDNRQLAFATDVRMPFNYRWNFLADFKNFNVENDFYNDNARMNYLKIGVGFSTKKWKFNATAGPAMGKYQKEISHKSFVFDFNTDYKMNGNHNFKLLAQRHVYDYTASLVDKDIYFTHFGLEYNGKVKNKLGVFGQYYHTFYSDDNSRESVLLSLYYNLKNVPVVKTGMNMQYIEFEKNKSDDYYSPSSLSIFEYFIEFNNLTREEKKWGVRLELVPGVLIEEKNKPAFNYRATGEFIIRPTKNIDIRSAIMTGENVAVDNNGYSMWKLELGAVYYFLKKEK